MSEEKTSAELTACCACRKVSCHQVEAGEHETLTGKKVMCYRDEWRCDDCKRVFVPKAALEAAERDCIRWAAEYKHIGGTLIGRTEKLHRVEHERDRLKERIASLEVDRERLWQMLQKYGEHLHDCDVFLASGNACNCGFNAKMEAIDAARKESK